MCSVFSVENLSYSLIVENSSITTYTLSLSSCRAFSLSQVSKQSCFQAPKYFIAIRIEFDRRLPACYLEQLWWVFLKERLDFKPLGLTMTPNSFMVLLLPGALIPMEGEQRREGR
jgi:hypothetical protein